MPIMFIFANEDGSVSLGIAGGSILLPLLRQPRCPPLIELDAHFFEHKEQDCDDQAGCREVSSGADDMLGTKKEVRDQRSGKEMTRCGKKKSQNGAGRTEAEKDNNVLSLFKIRPFTSHERIVESKG